MRTELTLVTPRMARDWLKQNSDNRPLRPGVVAGFMTAYERGEWKVTHQGVAFGTSGRLLDGQHRLTFISELPDGVSVPVNVTLGQDDDTFDAIDQGFKRTASDLYRVSADLVAVARFFAKVATPAGVTGGLTPQYVKPFIDWVSPEFEALITFCPTKVRMWASAPVRCAAIYNMKTGHNKDFVRCAYDALVHSNVGAMPSAVRVLTNQYMSGKIISARSLDLFCRSMRAFDSKNTAETSKIIVKDMSAQVATVRSFIHSEMRKNAKGKISKIPASLNWQKVA